MQPTDTSRKTLSAALKVMDGHLSALNEQNTLELAATMHFPHFRQVGTSLKVRETTDRYFDDFRARAGKCWAYTTLSSTIPISAPENKAHLAIKVNRFDNRDQLIADFESIWVITRINTVWAAQLRSSFAPAG